MSKVLVAGCGFLGKQVAARLLRAGSEVVALSRSLRDCPAGAAGFAADLRDAAALQRLPHCLSAIVFCAGADSYTESAYRDTYLEGLGNLLHVLSERGHRGRFIFTSSTTVYENDTGEWVDETTPLAPQRFGGRIMLQAEQRARASLPDCVILRSSGIYGAGRTGLIDSIRAGEATFAPGPSRYTNRIHKDDCAGAIVHLLRSAPSDDLYLASDDEPVDRRILLTWLASKLGAAQPCEKPLRSRRIAGNKRCSNARLKKTGFRFRFPSFREGYSHELGLD